MQYFVWLLLFVGVPLIIVWLFNYYLLIKYWRTLGWAVFFALVFSIPWDLWAVQSRIWSFPPTTNIGLLLMGLPVEEFFFMGLVTLLLGSLALVTKYRFMKTR